MYWKFPFLAVFPKNFRRRTTICIIHATAATEIINQVNNTYGVNLTEEDRLDLSRLSKRLIEDPEVQKYMKGDNTEDNKQSFFKQQFEGMMIDYINERFDFYKKMDDNPSMKNLIFQMMYKDYKNQQSGSISK